MRRFLYGHSGGGNSRVNLRVSGVAGGLFSGLAFALYSVLASRAMELPPLAGAAGFFTAPLAAAALNDGVSALWVFFYNLKKRHLGALRAGLGTGAGRLVIPGAVLGGPVANTLFLTALKNAGASWVLPVSALCPLFGCLFARLFLKQRISKKTALGMGVCILGTILVSLSRPAGTANLAAAFLCALAAAAFWALDGVCSAHAMKVMPPGAVLQIRQCISGSALLFVIMPALRSWPLLVKTAAAPLPALCLLFSSLFTALSYLNWYRANHLLGVAAGMSLNVTYVFWGVLLSALLFRQPPGFWNITGMLMATAGVWLIAGGQKIEIPGSVKIYK
jgi:drug/metabolite transporter (DMT)-like permease